MKAKELKLKTIEELNKIVAETRESTLSLNMERADRKLKKVAQYKKNRQLVSRILTIVAEKEKALKGRFIEILGSYNPHTKELNLKKDKAKEWMAKGAKPSNSLAILLKKEKIELPKWVEIKQKFKKPKEKGKKEGGKAEESPAPEVEEAAVVESEVKEIKIEEVESQAQPEEIKEEAESQPMEAPSTPGAEETKEANEEVNPSEEEILAAEENKEKVE